MRLNEQQFNEAIQYLEESWLESLIARPKEFFKKIKLYRVSLFKEDLVGQHSFNPGTRLSKPRMSSFWIAGKKEWTYIYGFRVAINDLFDKVSGYNYIGNSKEEKEKYFAKMKDECRFDLISEDGFCINATNYPEEFVRKNLRPVYLYELEIKGKDTGIGWHNKSEYTIDKDVKPNSITVLDYDFFKKVLKLEYVKEPQYKIRREEKRTHNQNKKKQPGYKKWDEKLGFPYADDPRTFMNQRCESFFNDAIKSAMREKNEEKRVSLLKDIGEKYKLVFGYRLGFFTGNIEIPKEYEYLFKEDLKEAIEYLEESLFKKKQNCFGYAFGIEKDLGANGYICQFFDNKPELKEEIEKLTNKKIEFISEKDAKKEKHVIALSFIFSKRNECIGFHFCKKDFDYWTSKGSIKENPITIDNDNVYSNWNNVPEFKDEGNFGEVMFIKVIN